MPRGDRTGPAGMGPKTGRALGYCAGYNMPGYMNPGFGRGFGRGYGRGFGKRFFWRNTGYGAPYAPVQEQAQYREPSKKELLNELKAEREEIEKAIKELEKKK